ncbi:MAG: hypothetical protein JNL85_08665 [Rubrivivax sp.]|nr:hypothetical protein [Rubrivivax sp.]
MKPIDRLTDDEWLALVQRAIAMPEVPPHLLQQALALWQQRPGAPAKASDSSASGPALRRWVAVLSFDSWAAAPAAAGMRALPSEVRQLLFSAEGCDVDLRVAPGPAGGGGADFTVSGQLLGPFAEGRIEIAAVGGSEEEPPAVRSVPVGPLDEFRVEGVRAGSYRITVRLGDAEIELPPLAIGPRAPGAG